MKILTGVEVCAGAGGQALGLAMAGFVHTALVEYEEEYCKILSQNRPEWPVICGDLHDFDGKPYRGVDLLSGGVPCPPFSVAGKQLGKDDERDLFPEALRLTEEINPKAVMLENVRGFLDPSFAIYRIQGFPDTWFFGKTKIRACRMIGNAFPPPVAKAVGEEIRRCLLNENSTFDKGKSSLSQETLDFNFDYR